MIPFMAFKHQAILKAVREPQTFWISSEPPVKKNVAALMDAYGLSLREQLDYGRETKRKRSRGGLAAAVVLTRHCGDTDSRLLGKE